MQHDEHVWAWRWSRHYMRGFLSYLATDVTFQTGA